MSKSNSKRKEKTISQVDEAPVPRLMRISLRALLVLGVAPARLLRTRKGYFLKASRTLTTLQRLIAVIINMSYISATIMDFQMEPKKRVYVGSSVLKYCMSVLELCLTVVVHSLGVSAALDERQITFLQDIHKINKKLNRISSPMKYGRLKQCVLTVYVVWNIATHLSITCKIIYNVYIFKGHGALACLWVAAFYQILVVALIQLYWSTVLNEINSTLTYVNNTLESLLKTTTTIKLEGSLIRLLNVSYDSTCELINQFTDHHGPFLCFYFLLLLVTLLTSPYNLLMAVEQKKTLFAIQHTNWILLHLTQLLTFVEPCHRLQNQKNRTKRLLNALAHKATRRRHFPVSVKPFILQCMVSDSSLTLCDFITVSRQILATVIGTAFTYLIIIIQSQSTAETL